MKTAKYNPSVLEVEIARAIEKLQGELEKHIPDHKITNVESDSSVDNPIVKLFLQDEDGDPHEVVLKIIQTPDKF